MTEPLPISLRDSLLLSQAIVQHGTSSWEQISTTLQRSSSTSINEMNLPTMLKSAQGCKSVWQRLINKTAAATGGRAAANDSTMNVLPPQARISRKITRQLYSTLLKSTHDKLTKILTEEAKLSSEIDSIKSGQFDQLSPRSKSMFIDASTLSSRDKIEPKEEEEEEEAESTADRRSTSEPEAKTTTTTTSSTSTKVIQSRRRSNRSIGAANQSRGTTIEPTPEVEDEPRHASADAEESNQDSHDEDDDDEEEEEEDADEDDVKSTRSSRARSKSKQGSVVPMKRTKRRTTAADEESGKDSPGPIEGPSSSSSRKKIKTGHDDNDDMKAFRKSMNMLLDNLTNEAYTHPFKEPVLKRDAKTYYVAIKRPLSIVEIKKKLRSVNDGYSNATEVARDIALLCANARQFNPSVKDPDDIAGQAEQTWRKLEELMQLHMSSNS